MRRIDYIVIHCTAGYGDVNAIKRFWNTQLGWRNPGYHYFIYEDGRYEQLAPLSTVTNGVLGYNQQSVHIAYQGGVERDNYTKAKDTRTKAQKETIIKLIGLVINDLNKYQSVGSIKILGHRDFSPDKNGNGVIEPWERIKECPSFDAIPEYTWIRGNQALRSTSLLTIALLMITLLASCGTRKKTTSKHEAISTTGVVSVGVDVKKTVETIGYGGHLKGQIPLSVIVNDADSVVIEGKGQTLTLRNSSGNLHFNATATPTNVTTSTEETHIKADSTATHHIETNEANSDHRFSWSLPLWVWLLAAFVLIVVFIKPILKLFKPF